MRKTVVAIFVFLCVSNLSAGTITSLSPASFKVNSGEQFITVYGTGLGNRFIFDGPAGHFELYVNATFTDRVVGWVPEAVIAKSGTYSLSVTGPNGTSGPAYFNVTGFRFPLVLLLPEYMRVQPRTREGQYAKYEVFAIGGEDPNPTVTCEPASGSFFPMGITPVKCVASNIYGERASGSFVVNVRDEVAPELKLPEPIVVKAEMKEGSYVKFEAAAFDDIYGELPVECSPASGSLFPVGVTNVHCTATDPDLNIGHGIFPVEVIGELEPYPLDVIVPDRIVEDAWDARGAPVKFEVYVEGTKDREPVVTCTHESGQIFPVGDTVVACDAIDAWGMRGSASFTISVLDRRPPEIYELKASPDSLFADNRLYPIEVYVGVVDDIDIAPVCEIETVTSQEDIDLDDLEDPKSYDWRITGPRTLELRAERFGTSRNYYVWILCSDYFGNQTRTYSTVTVTGGTASKMTAPRKSGRRRSVR